MHPDWMTGTWEYLGPDDPPRETCRSGTDLTAYSHRGYWVGIAVGDYGRWWMRGSTLVHSILKEGGGSAADRGTTYSFDVVRVRHGELTFRNKDGVSRMVRCGKDADGWFGKGVPH